MDITDKYNDVVSIIELNEEDLIAATIIFIIPFFNSTMYYLDKLLDTLKKRGYDGKCSIYNNIFTIELNCDIVHKIKFITPTLVKENKMRGLDNYYIINMCDDFDESILLN